MNRLLYPLIEPAIDKALRDLRADPRRGALSLVDTGLRFSRDPGRRAILTNLRQALQHPGCAYPDLLNRIVSETDPRAFKTIGRNLIRGTFGDGADQLAKLEDAWQRPLPRCIAFDLRQAESEFPPLSRLDDLVRQGKSLGIYAYLLLTAKGGYTPKGLQRLLTRHQDCIFLLVSPPAAFHAEDIPLLLSLPHLLCCLSLEGAETEAIAETAALLRRSRMLYGGLAPCDAGSSVPQTLEVCANLGFAFAVLLETTAPPPETTAENQRQTDHARTVGSYPLAPFYLSANPAHRTVLQLEWNRDHDFFSGVTKLTLGQYLRSLPL